MRRRSSRWRTCSDLDGCLERRQRGLLAGEIRRSPARADPRRRARIGRRRGDARRAPAASRVPPFEPAAATPPALSRRVSATRTPCSVSAICLLQFGERRRLRPRPPPRAAAAAPAPRARPPPRLRVPSSAGFERASARRRGPRPRPLPDRRCAPSASVSCTTCCVMPGFRFARECSTAARAASPRHWRRRRRPAGRAACRRPRSGSARSASSRALGGAQFRLDAPPAPHASAAISVVHFLGRARRPAAWRTTACAATSSAALRVRDTAVATSACCSRRVSWLPSSTPDVLDARQILARVGEAAFGLLAALLVLRDARGLLEEDAQLLGLGLDDARDHPLLDDRIGARPRPVPRKMSAMSRRRTGMLLM